MTRSSKKPPFIDYSLLKAVSKRKKNIKTRSRRSTILPDMVGLIISVYNGTKYIPVSINESMVGYKLGEFSPTRTYHGHGADKKSRR